MCRNHRKPLHVGLVRIIEPLSLRLVGIIIPGHGLKHGVAVRVIGVINLISNTPENNAGMVSVPSYHGPQVLLMPLWKVLKISLMPGRIDIMPYRPFVFRIFPFIKSLIHHEKSHGESFLAIAQNYMKAGGIFIFDEPEAALSPQRQLTLLMDIYKCAKDGAQFIIVTHSPILLGMPEAEIYSFDNGEVHLCEYEDTDSYIVTELFINNRDILLHRLLNE
ncbi:MAG: AAA family ATPase [Dorea sp.]|nr:AAA family ATPase [Dorea sp.]